MNYQTGRALGRTLRAKPFLTSVAVAAAMVGFMVLAYRASIETESERRVPPITPAIQPPPLAPKPLDPQDAKRGAVGIGARSLRAAMHDPSSFELEEASLMADGAGCYTYRSQNGFNAIRRSHAVLTPSMTLLNDNGAPIFAATWNKYCAGKTGENITSAVRAVFL